MGYSLVSGHPILRVFADHHFLTKLETGNPKMLAQTRSNEVGKPKPLSSHAALRKRPGLPTRTGATLVFVVTLLVLFTLAGTTFLVVASQFQQSARKAARASTYLQPPKNYTEDALYDLIRGNTGNNIVTPHSILGDKYDVLSLSLIHI